MSNLYQKSMQQIRFSEEFDNNTISKMKAAAKNRRPKNRIKVLCGVAAVAAAAGIVWFICQHAALPLETPINDVDAVAVESASPESAESVALLSAQEKIIEQQEYGVVSLSTQSAEIIQSIAKRAGIADDEAADVSCYEDDEYYYFFYPDGTVAGVMAADGDTDEEDEPWVKLSEDEAVALAKSVLLKYCDSYTEDTAGPLYGGDPQCRCGRHPALP